MVKPDLADPSVLGLDPAQVDELLERARRGVGPDGLPSCQLALACEGRLVLSVTLGEADDSSRYVVFSVTKALVAAATWLLFGDRLLAPETRVADVVPEFAAEGKDGVTVEHLLTHTAGFPRAPMRPEEGATRDGRLARFATWRLDWPPGSRTEYHATSAHWVLAELLERASGVDYRAFVHDRVLAPLGLDALRLGVPPTEQGGVLDVRMVGTDSEPRPGVPVVAEAAAEHLLRFNDPAVRAVGVPGAGAVGRAGDVALFFQALLHNPGGLWDPAVLADATGHVRTTLPDAFTRVPANRTLGLVVAGDDGNAALRELGRSVGPRAFGASGVGGQVAWADPDSGLSFCYLTNGIERDPVASFVRSDRVSTAAGRCARATSPPDDASDSSS